MSRLQTVVRAAAFAPPAPPHQAAASGTRGSRHQGENPAGDALLLALAAQLPAIVAREEEAYRVKGEATTDEAEEAAQAVADAAFEEWADVIVRMSETPADGLAGLAVKAAQACRALEGGETTVDGLLADSLKADITRLVPAAVVS